ncbi:MAG TPA: cysteine desulfurase-like protein [Acidimicrobiia bacterium]|jgi:cysteine desulfurase family protein (TIGR01976 family)
MAIDSAALRLQFPGAQSGWARFDGPAGTQMHGYAIDAMQGWAASGDNANCGGAFAASAATDELLASTREIGARFFGAPTPSVWFGPNMTTMTFAFTRAIARHWKPGDRIVGTRLDHDANVSTWRAAAADRGAELVLADFDRATGQLDLESIGALLDDRTRWVAVTGASNLLGTIPDVAAIAKLAHDAGARVFVDAVHLAPHVALDVAALGCDAIVTSAYKWYGPHAAMMWVDPELAERVESYKVRPASNQGVARFETGTANFEALAGVRAAAHFMLERGAEVAAHERACFAGLLDGLASIPRVAVVGPKGLEGRTPTVAFVVDGCHPADVARDLAHDRIAVWSGDSYATEVAAHLGIDDTGGVVRAGVVAYVDDDDVSRLVASLERICHAV